MILDTSAFAAIFFDEPEPALYTRAVLQIDMFFPEAGSVIEPFTVERAQLARQAFHNFGKGRHPAAPNFGGCFAYALAKFTGEPLLFKGDDLKKTGIVSVL